VRQLKILVSNDDGIEAIGLRFLVHAASKFGEVFVSAPRYQKSASSQAVTLLQPIKVEEFSIPEAKKAFAVYGTPADAAKFGLYEAFPDCNIVLSGINAGPNLGTDILYSGTVAAAAEAAIMGKFGIAVSVTDYKPTEEVLSWILPSLEATLHFIFQLIDEKPTISSKLFNVNIPPLPLEEIKGVKFTFQNPFFWFDKFKPCFSPHGIKYYWLTGEKTNILTAPNSDEIAVKNGYISITPLTVDMTDYTTLKELNNITVNLESFISRDSPY